MTAADYLRPLLDHPLVRRAAWLAFLSWVSALTVTGYLFGLSDGFFGRWFSATLVLWLLLLAIVLGIIPLVRWLTHRLEIGTSGPPRRRPPAAPRRPATRPAKPLPPQIPANKWR